MNPKTRTLIIGVILLCVIVLGLALGYTGQIAPGATSPTAFFTIFPVSPGAFENPLFEHVFPQVNLIASCQLGVLEQPNICTTKAVWGEKEYRLPYDFNQLMVDYGYSLNEQTRDDLAYAFIVTGLLLEVATQPMTCEPGEVIDEPVRPDTSARYGYRVFCHTSAGDVVVKFDPFTDQFGVVSIRKIDGDPVISFSAYSYKQK